jgi:hypothetical protein
LESEAAINGAQMFGPATDVRREFCLLGVQDGVSTWFFHQSYDEEELSIHYVRDESGVQRRDGKAHAYLEGEELDNFIKATEVYHDYVSREVYHRRPADVNGDGIVDQRDLAA